MAKKKQDESSHSESWLVSYCDMISLLVTFFLMMMTFSTKEEFDVHQVGIGLLNGRGGIWQSPISFPEQEDVDPSVVSRLARDLAALNEVQAGEQPTSIQKQQDGFTISFDTKSSFAPGSTVVTPALHKNLVTLAGALQSYTNLVVVEGFTDDRFQPTPQFPTAEAIGIARAQAAARVMLENSLISPDQLQISSVGMLRPRTTNDSATGRTSNRRVEIRVVSLAKPKLVPSEAR
jgi:chemotaxis protein MotB